jgi:release factor glutamine methyltransferase
VRDDLAAATVTLARAGVDTPRADAEWLLAGLLGVGRAGLALTLGTELDVETARRYDSAVRRRAGREPLQRILGWEGFRGLRLHVTPEVMVPRPETETLVEWSLALVPAPRVVVDVGTGSGCIACAIAAERPAVHVVAVDRSPAAAAVAAANVETLGLGHRVRVVVGDVLAPLGAVDADLIVANLPYLPTALLGTLSPEVSRHDPAAALDGGVDGLDVQRRVAAGAGAWLRPGGALLIETGADQAPHTAALFSAAGLTPQIAYAEDATVVIGER